MQNKKILISGGGVAGLTLAFWLKRHGFIPTIVEKHPELRTGGYKIDIRGIALDVIEKMGLFEEVSSYKTEIARARVMESGGAVAEMDADTCGGRINGDIEIMRGDLCKIIYDHTDIEYIFGSSIQAITEDANGLIVEFDTKESRHFDLCIGADGLHSTVRALSFGDEKQYLKELGIYLSVYSVPDYFELGNEEIEYFDEQRFINLYHPKNADKAKAGFAFFSKHIDFDYKNRSEQQNILKEAFSQVGWEVPRLMLAMDDSPDFYFDAAAQVHMPDWHRGRVALVGDAGYAPSAISGQGSSVALVGAYALAGELVKAKGDYQPEFWV